MGYLGLLTGEGAYKLKLDIYPHGTFLADHKAFERAMALSKKTLTAMAAEAYEGEWKDVGGRRVPKFGVTYWRKLNKVVLACICASFGGLL